jgi:TerC family integral membrane protein
VSVSIWFWVAFHLGVLIALAVDLFSDRAHERISLPSAIRRSFLWVGLSLSFNAFVWWWVGADQAVDFFTGYLIEYSLSVDNIFVFGLIFAYFRVPPRYEHRVLVWGILGALIMRAIMIGLGVTLVSHFHFVLYIFGAFLVITGLRMMLGKSQPIDLEHNYILRFVRRMLPVTNDYHGPKFLALVGGRWMLTPLALVALLPARQSREAFHLLAPRVGDYPLFRRLEDVGRTMAGDPELAFAPYHPRGAGHDYHHLTPRDQKSIGLRGALKKCCNRGGEPVYSPRRL